MSSVSAICFTFAFALISTAFRKRADVFAPYRVFGTAWLTAIGLADLKYSFFQREWSTYAWLVIFVGVCSTLLGFLIVSIVFMDRPILSLSEQRKLILKQKINGDVLYKTVIVLSILYAIAFVAEVIIAGGVPAFAAKPDRARVDFGFFGTHLIVTSVPAILFLGTEYMVFCWKESKRSRKFFLILAYAAVFLSFSLLLVRFLYVMWAVPTLCLLYYGTTRLKFRQVGISVLGFFGFLQIIRSIRIVGYVENYSYVIARMRFPKTYAIFSEPYMYIVMNLENFARSVDRWTSFTYGYFTFDFLMAMTGLKHPLAKEYDLVERPFLISGYNTFSFLMPFYQDFGILGVAFIPLCIGICVGYIYHSMRRHPTIGNITLYSFAAYFLLISFFNHALGMLLVFVNMSLLIYVHYILLARDRTTNALA